MSLTKEQTIDKKTDEEQGVMPEVKDADQFVENILASVGSMAVSEVIDPSVLDDAQEGNA